MQNEQNNIQDYGITIGDILSAMFCKKLLMLIITLAITLIGTLGIRLVYDSPKEVYTAGFHLNAINLENGGKYIDGSKFDYRDMISLDNLNRAKETETKFSGIDTAKLISEGYINIDKKEVYDEVAKETEKKTVIKETYYQITLKKKGIGGTTLARDYVKALVGLAISDNNTKTETMDYTSNLTSYDSSNRYDTQITYLQNQFDLIINGYASLTTNYGNVASNNKNISEYSKLVSTYFADYTFANLKSELDQYGYIKDYTQNGRVYYTAVNNNVDTYKVNALKIQKLESERDAVLNKYKEIGGAGGIQNTGLETIYNQIAELSTAQEDIKQSIRINLRRLATHYTQAELESAFAEALSILELPDASNIYEDMDRGDEATFKANLTRFRTKLTEFTNEYKAVSKDVVSKYSTAYYKDSGVVELTGGLGLVKALLISLALGFVIACVVNMVIGKERFTFEYRMKKRIERGKKYGLLITGNTITEVEPEKEEKENTNNQ